MAIDAVKDFSLDMTGAGDNSQQLAKLHSVLSGTSGPLPLVKFSEGICAFSQWPNFGRFANLQIVAEGVCVLKHIGNGDAVTFDGDVNSPGEGKRNIRFVGFTILPGPNTNHGLVIAACHNSHFRANVRGAGNPKNGQRFGAFVSNYTVCTVLDNPTVSFIDSTDSIGFASADCFGIVLNHSPVQPGLQTSDMRIINPVVENVTYGAWVNDAGGTSISAGVFENCTEGFHLVIGGQNRMWATWFEGNKDYDVVMEGTSKDNDFNVTHPSKLKTKIQGYNNVVRSTVGLFG